ncbi:PQQ-binding-like beta-propeller repeat protein [Patescibacteria group bacterium]|nr:PQQ-binding-like beta-propeller repeat protein [Patescibacteria group bacterium]
MNKKLAYTIAILILLLIIGGAIYFYVRLDSSNKSSTTSLINQTRDTSGKYGETEFPETNIYNNGTIYSLTNWGEILAIDINRGDTRWTTEVIEFPVKNDFFRITQPPEIYRDNIIFSYYLGYWDKFYIFSIDANSGDMKWEKKMSGGEIIDADSVGVYISQTNTNYNNFEASTFGITMLDSEDGSTIWETEETFTPTPNEFHLADNTITALASDTSNEEKHLFVFDKLTGENLWELHMEGKNKFNYTMLDNYIFIDNFYRDEEDLFYELKTGKSIDLPEVGVRVLYHNNNKAFLVNMAYGTNEVSINAFNTNNFEKLWEHTRPVPYSIGIDDRLVCDEMGTDLLYCRYSKYKDGWVSYAFVLDEQGGLVWEKNNIEDWHIKNDILYHFQPNEDDNYISKFEIMDPQTGEIKWFINLDSTDMKLDAYKDNISVMHQLKGTQTAERTPENYEPTPLIAYNTYNKLWEFNSEGLPSVVYIGDDLLLIQDKKKNYSTDIISIDLTTGQELWRVNNNKNECLDQCSAYCGNLDWPCELGPL